ncbi:AGE family epimerase/isomerase [Alteromonas mediterranea]|uniref:AGE family epimerase/isomerase n=1 Tax=Alteromonas mediterranea TaxID=314275 RepID=UPI0012FAA337|nr:AGE family epimerase/isomerase [Alteromonas mediterranea]QGX62836.1 AGE family epimerase/isomerase [Alteromonas mediterranea]
MTTQPNFASNDFLHDHIKSILAFYEPNVDAVSGGFHQNFMDDGSIFDEKTRHLVSSTRFVFNYARAYLAYGDTRYKARVESGIQFLRDYHLQEDTGGYAWLLDVNGKACKVVDATNHCYGLAFVILAYSWALRAGVKEAEWYIHDAFALMETHFWDAEYGLYKDEFNADFSRCSDYRGQNANMHSCEALIAAFEATGHGPFLERALLLAHNITERQADKADGRIWEHYTKTWEVDWEYNKDDPKNLFRPWGFQPGHHTEWAKLLLQIHQYQPQDWLVARARSLFDAVIDISWDNENGGLYYGFAPDSRICDDEKYFWVQAESFACAARLALETGEDKYWQWYHRIWDYAWSYMVDHKYGAWFRILSAKNQKLETTKSPVGKTDYHTMGACYDVLDALSFYK